MTQRHLIFPNYILGAVMLSPGTPLLAQTAAGEECPVCDECSVCVARIADVKAQLSAAMRPEDLSFAKAALVRLGLDYDNDDEIDAVELITAIDLERARERSRERLQDAGLNAMQQVSQLQQKQLTVEPAGWVRVALDFDKDKQADAYELIYNQDLEQARTKSRNRLQQSGFDPSALQAQAQRQRLSGEITSLRSIKLRGLPQPHLIARVRIQAGPTLAVDLGPEQQLDQLNLQPGDSIMVSGQPGTLDRRYVLLADLVQSQDQFLRINRPLQNLKTLRGEILATRIANLGGQECLLVQVERDDGQVVTVDLGPPQQIRQIALLPGNPISVLGQLGQISGRPALFAKKVKADGQVRTIRQRLQRDQFQQAQFEPSQQFESLQSHTQWPEQR